MVVAGAACVRHHAPAIRVWIAKRCIARWTGLGDVELREAIVSTAPLRVVLLGVGVPNPRPEQASAPWAHRLFVSAELVEVVADTRGRLAEEVRARVDRGDDVVDGLRSKTA